MNIGILYTQKWERELEREREKRGAIRRSQKQQEDPKPRPRQSPTAARKPVRPWACECP
jgi:hypothetical protein